MSITQDLYKDLFGRRNDVQFRVDILNVGNLINKNWGTGQRLINAQPLTITSGAQADSQGRAQYQPAGRQQRADDHVARADLRPLGRVAAAVQHPLHVQLGSRLCVLGAAALRAAGSSGNLHDRGARTRTAASLLLERREAAFPFRSTSGQRSNSGSAAAAPSCGARGSRPARLAGSRDSLVQVAAIDFDSEERHARASAHATAVEPMPRKGSTTRWRRARPCSRGGTRAAATGRWPGAADHGRGT